MPDFQRNALRKPLNDQASLAARNYVREFATLLILQAKIVAHQRNDEMVLKNHIDEALEVINRQRKESRFRQFYTIFGGALVGAAVPGFITEVTSQTVKGDIVSLYTVLGLIGLGLVLWGLRGPST